MDSTVDTNAAFSHIRIACLLYLLINGAAKVPGLMVKSGAFPPYCFGNEQRYSSHLPLNLE